MSAQARTLFADSAGLDTALPADPDSVLSTQYDCEMAANILRVVMEYQRRAADASCVSHPCDSCIAVHRGRLMRLVSRNVPVDFVLPAFPAKSPNMSKVLGVTPDMAEQLSLAFLYAVCDRIRQIYRPGVRLIVCSDGRVFSDLVRISDSNISRYPS